MKKLAGVPCVCKTCGKEFTVIPARHRLGRGVYCSKACTLRQVIRICPTCSVAFTPDRTNAARGLGNYCSRNCYFVSRRPKVGDVFGRLTVIAPVYVKDGKWGEKAWVTCRCTCETVREYALFNLKNGGTVSCGCLARELRSIRSRTHGGTDAPLYGVWTGIKRRCQDPNDPGYPRYGGRGISVCPEWATDFAAFRDWALANGWQKGLDTDRINNDSGYRPGNIRFVPSVVSMRNRGTTVFATAFGETRPVAEWAEDARCRVGYRVLARRIREGWDAEGALTTPIQSQYSH